jgi:hypothetical protein
VGSLAGWSSFGKAVAGSVGCRIHPAAAHARASHRTGKQSAIVAVQLGGGKGAVPTAAYGRPNRALHVFINTDSCAHQENSRKSNARPSCRLGGALY